MHIHTHTAHNTQEHTHTRAKTHTHTHTHTHALTRTAQYTNPQDIQRALMYRGSPVHASCTEHAWCVSLKARTCLSQRLLPVSSLRRMALGGAGAAPGLPGLTVSMQLLAGRGSLGQDQTTPSAECAHRAHTHTHSHTHTHTHTHTPRRCLPGQVHCAMSVRGLLSKAAPR